MKSLDEPMGVQLVKEVMLGIPRDGKDSTYSWRNIIVSVPECFNQGLRIQSKIFLEVLEVDRRRGTLLLDSLKNSMKFIRRIEGEVCYFYVTSGRECGSAHVSYQKVQ